MNDLDDGLSWCVNKSNPSFGTYGEMPSSLLIVRTTVCRQPGH
jgi:hypothetical protein